MLETAKTAQAIAITISKSHAAAATRSHRKRRVHVRADRERRLFQESQGWRSHSAAKAGIVGHRVESPVP